MNKYLAGESGAAFNFTAAKLFIYVLLFGWGVGFFGASFATWSAVSQAKAGQTKAGQTKEENGAAAGQSGATVSESPATAKSDASDGSPAYLLRYKFKEGQTLRWEVVHRTRTRTTMKETTIVADMYSQSEKRWTVKEIDKNGAALLENSVGWLNMWQEMTGQAVVKYDSRIDKTVPDVYKSVSRMIQAPLSQLRIDTRGEVTNRKDFFPTTSNQQLNPSQLTMPLPEAPLRVGDSWQIEKFLFLPKSDNVMLKVRTVQVYTLETVEGQKAVIDYRTRILTPIHDPGTEAQLVQCRTKGKIVFDLEKGQIVSQEQNLDHAVPHFSGEASTVRYINKFTESWIGD